MPTDLCSNRKDVDTYNHMKKITLWHLQLKQISVPSVPERRVFHISPYITLSLEPSLNQVQMMILRFHWEIKIILELTSKPHVIYSPGVPIHAVWSVFSPFAHTDLWPGSNVKRPQEMEQQLYFLSYSLNVTL